METDPRRAAEPVEPPWPPGPARPSLAPSDVHLWCLDLCASAEALTAGLALLSPDERERMRGFRFERDASRYAVGRAALRSLLARYLDRDAAAIGFRYTRHGKPELDDTHDPRAGARRLRFNLAHSEDVALLAVTLGNDVGVDVEYLRVLPDRDAVARNVFSPAEWAEYEALAPDRRATGFFHGWTRKEAWLKARGDGLIGDLAGFDVTLTPGREAHVLRVSGADEEARAWRLLGCVPRAGFVAAVAVRDPAARFVAWSA